MPQPCIYTTQFDIWLDAAALEPAGKTFCFRSAKKWTSAAKLLEEHGPLPVFIRQQGDEEEDLACSHAATLVKVFFSQSLSPAEARARLDKELWLQRKTIQANPSPAYATWEEQYEDWEVKNFLKDQTWYTLRDLRKIDPLPLPRLKKLKDGEPLASNYTRGYAICIVPDGFASIS